MSFSQQTCETLGDQASTDDELIARHLYLLAKMSVRRHLLCVENWIIDIFNLIYREMNSSLTKMTRIKRLAMITILIRRLKSLTMANYCLVLVTYRIKKHWKLLVHCG